MYLLPSIFISQIFLLQLDSKLILIETPEYQVKTADIGKYNLFDQLRYKHISVNFTLLLSKYSTAMQKDILNFK
jgi:hypothetical protein